MAENFFCDGVEMAPQRSLFNALGMTHEEMKRPDVYKRQISFLSDF